MGIIFCFLIVSCYLYHIAVCVLIHLGSHCAPAATLYLLYSDFISFSRKAPTLAWPGHGIGVAGPTIPTIEQHQNPSQPSSTYISCVELCVYAASPTCQGPSDCLLLFFHFISVFDNTAIVGPRIGPNPSPPASHGVCSYTYI